MATYAVLGSTGNCGTSLIQLLLRRPNVKVHAYCRDRAKLARLLPHIEANPKVDVFEGSIRDVPLLTSCLRDCRAIFMVVSTNTNIPGLHAAQDCAKAVIGILRELKQTSGAKVPKLVLLSSATIDETLSQMTPYVLRQILHWSASNVYKDLVEAEKLLRAEENWLTCVYVKPGALSEDLQRGHALSWTESDNPVSYLDLAAAMIEVTDDGQDRYNQQNLGVVNANEAAKIPLGTALTILSGLLRHFLPFLHPYLP